MTRCKPKTRKCVDGKCYYKKRLRKNSKKGRCPAGTRRCRDNKCHVIKKIDLN